MAGANFKKGVMPKDMVKREVITIQQNPRKTQDIGGWRQALSAFENPHYPNRVPLFDLLEDVELDGQVVSTWGKRIAPLLNKELLFVRDGIEDEELIKLLNCYDMISLKRAFLDAIKYGHVLVQINSIWYDEDEETYKIDFDKIPRKHVHPEPGWECISKMQALSKDILYRERPLFDYMVEVEFKEQDLRYGLLYPLAQYVIYKRGGFGDWAQFSELFGMPFREYEYDAFDDSTRVMLEQAAANFSGAGYILRPKGTSVTIHDVGSAGNQGGPYDALISKCDAAIAKMVVGNTLTTEQGDKGSQSLGKVHQEGEDEVNEMDAKLLLAIINGKFRAVLKRFGFNVAGGQIWFKSADKNWDELQKKWTVYKELKDAIPFEDDFLYEEFDVPKPANYDQLKADAEAKQKSDAETAAQAQKDIQAVQKQQTKLFDKISTIRLFDFFVKAPAAIGAAVQTPRATSQSFTKGNGINSPLLGRGVGGEVLYLAEQAQADFNISEIFFTALRNIYEEKVNVDKEIETNLWQYTADRLHAAIDEGIPLPSPVGEGSGVRSFSDLLKQQLSVFSAFKTYAQQQELSRLLLDENGDLKPFNQFLTDSKSVIGKYNENWLQTEYDTAVLRSRIAQQWQEFEANADLFPNLKWLESTSVEKRAFHRKFSDIPLILPINHPFWLKHRPGDLWNCKCGITSTNEPETPANLIPDVDFKAAPGLDNNPAVDGKIFSDTHPIIANADKVAVKAVKKFMAERVKSDVVLRVKVDVNPKKIDEYQGKKGGSLTIVEQNSNEAKKNLTTYKLMADNGGRYKLLNVVEKEDGIKHPDALNLTNGYLSDAKHPETRNGKNAIQNAIKDASKQKVEEVIIRLDKSYSVKSLYDGFKSALQSGRAKTLKTIILIRKNTKPQVFNVDDIRKLFTKK